MIAEQYPKAEDRLPAERGIFHLLVLDQQPDYRGKLSVSDILRVVASDEKIVRRSVGILPIHARMEVPQQFVDKYA